MDDLIVDEFVTPNGQQTLHWSLADIPTSSQHKNCLSRPVRALGQQRHTFRSRKIERGRNAAFKLAHKKKKKKETSLKFSASICSPASRWWAERRESRWSCPQARSKHSHSQEFSYSLRQGQIPRGHVWHPPIRSPAGWLSGLHPTCQWVHLRWAASLSLGSLLMLPSLPRPTELLKELKVGKCLKILLVI